MTVSAAARPASVAALLLLTPAVASAQGIATHTRQIWGVVFSADEQFVATTASAELRLWSLPGGELACRLDGTYWGAEAVADGASSFLVTINDYVMTGGGRKVPQRAFRVDAATCAQTPVALGAAPSSPGASMVAGSGGQSVTLPGGRTVTGSFRAAALADGARVYTCSADSRPVRNRSYSTYRTTYERIDGSGRPERLAQADDIAGCGTLALTPDGQFLTDTNGGVVLDLRRRRVAVRAKLPRVTSVGVDAAGGRAGVGFDRGYVVYDLRTGRASETVQNGLGSGYVSPSMRYIALASGITERPVVEVRPSGGASVRLDDARSRAGADAVLAAREAETRARNDALRRQREAEAAESARLRAAADARVDHLRASIEELSGRITVTATLRQIQYQGAYSWIRVELRSGDRVILATESGRKPTFSIVDAETGTTFYTDAATGSAGFPIDGFLTASSTMTQAATGDLRVSADGAPVHVFIVRAADGRR